MDSLIKPQVADETCVRVLQLTDMHLFADRSQQLLGINTFDSFQAVLNAIEHTKQHTPLDLIVITGDLAQEPSLQVYRVLHEGLSRLKVPCVWTPGNHDDATLMAQVLLNEPLRASKLVLLGDHWQIILLNSQLPGEVAGRISEKELCWLEANLNQAGQRHSLVFLHHHPVDSGCDWLDRQGLLQPEQLAAILRRYPRVQGVICGHIHQELDKPWQNKRVFATPSTCVQFSPLSQQFSLDQQQPGWRWFELHSHGELHSWVERLTGHDFVADMSAQGYE